MTEKPAVPQSLGEFLRSEREKRGVTVEQMVSATKISLRLLHALEGDQYAELPAKPFIRGFVVSYCRFLGVNPQEVLTQFSRYLDERSEDRPKRDGGHSGYVFDRREGEGARTGLWVLMGSMLLVGGLVVVIFKPALKHRRKSHVEKLQQVVATATPSDLPTVATSVVPVVMASPVPRVEPSAVPSSVTSPASLVTEASTVASPSRKPDPMLSGKDLLKEEIRVKVVVRALEDVWVKFRVDSKDKNRLVLRQGGVLVLYARDAAVFQVSTPSAVTVARSVGEPLELKSLGGSQRLSDLLEKKQEVTTDGRSLYTRYQRDGELLNPFEGEPLMAPPPPKPQRTPSKEASGAPDLSTG